MEPLNRSGWLHSSRDHGATRDRVLGPVFSALRMALKHSTKRDMLAGTGHSGEDWGVSFSGSWFVALLRPDPCSFFEGHFGCGARPGGETRVAQGWFACPVREAAS